MSAETYRALLLKERLSKGKTRYLGKLALEVASHGAIALNYGIGRSQYFAASIYNRLLLSTENAAKLVGQRLSKSHEKWEENEDLGGVFLKQLGGLATKSVTKLERVSKDHQVKARSVIENNHINNRGRFWERSLTTRQAKHYIQTRRQENKIDRDNALETYSLQLENHKVKQEKRKKIDSIIESRELRNRSREIRQFRDTHHQGTPINEVREVNVERVNEFLEKMQGLGFPKSIIINEGEKSRPTYSRNIGRRLLGQYSVKVASADEPIDPIYAYPVGISRSPSELLPTDKNPAQDVYLCSDGTFRRYIEDRSEVELERWVSLPIGEGGEGVAIFGDSQGTKENGSKEWDDFQPTSLMQQLEQI